MKKLIGNNGGTIVHWHEKFHEVNGADLCIGLVERNDAYNIKGHSHTMTVEIIDSKFRPSGCGDIISGSFGDTPVNIADKRVIKINDIPSLIEKIRKCEKDYGVRIDVRCNELNCDVPAGLNVYFHVRCANEELFNVNMK